LVIIIIIIIIILIIDGILVPAVKSGDSFRYLGRHFDFDMSNNMHKSELSDTLNATLSEIDLLPLHPKNKLLFYEKYLLSNSPGILQLQTYLKLGSAST